ncbi:ubiquitin carboxyl-terminal hydrolase CYLD [Uranotaenia lowii]|uniref:ubiquitin carboxyl-terminal hydrolase CYLD n=1 Tax=Uranotaenia lowii TaxID=190385 RepID=UPI00247A4B42|nr:ubiquitin carboxyl-terminal hydrolase CYLD [Uranotaenia lowii]XP_055593354.1 ubiquitin carboxyl-terminal hydrolase CYLD [Uranotaenia lowii]XP_055593355.1 ubiquitin carboxyl-terminal hydrolase CYLD [Uranotaenia lowii]
MTANFAISLRKINAKLVSVENVAIEDDNSFTIDPGRTLKITEQVSNKIAIVGIHNYHNPEEHDFSTHQFQVPVSHLQKVPGDVWPFVIAIVDPEERINFAKDAKRGTWVTRLTPGQKVVLARSFGYPSEVCDCTIRYIGQITEMGPGYHFALEMTHCYEPLQKDIDYIKSYCEIDTNRALIVTANYLEFDELTHSGSKNTKKGIVHDFLCGAKQKFKRPGGKLGYFESIKSNSQEDTPTRSYTPDLTGTNRNSVDFSKPFEGTMDAGYYKKMAASISSPNLCKQDSSSSTGSSSRLNSNPMERLCDEHRYNMDSFTEDSYRSGRSSQNSSNNSTLKHSEHRKKSLSKSKLIYVIDKTDIEEATSGASDVIIVDPPVTLAEQDHGDVDLKDILGKDWPTQAGHAATILNNDQRAQAATTRFDPNEIVGPPPIGGTGGYNSSSSSNSASSHGYHSGKFERNKSLNILSHFSHSKPRETNRKREQRNMMDASTMTKLNDVHHEAGLRSSSPFLLPEPVQQASDLLIPNDCIQPSPLNTLPDNPDLGCGSMVEVEIEEKDSLLGVIRWIGPLHPPGMSSSNTRVMVGVELEDEPFIDIETSDGVHNGMKLFECNFKRGIFVYPEQCRQDKRFDDSGPHSINSVKASSSKSTATNTFGKVDCPPVTEDIAPLKILEQNDLKAICGKFKGIQGHHNSCYLDATLFSMFTFTSVFDSLLYRPREEEDNLQYEEVQRVLREEIVNPLRKNHFVRADRVMKLRELLDRLSSVTGLTSEEKDPEEFLNSLLAQILRADPFLKLSSGLDTFYYQLFVEKDDSLKLPSVQQLFEQSFLTSSIKLKEVPSCLIIQMPRFGKNFKMYPRILPSQILEVTDIIEDSPRQCSWCGKLADKECHDCYTNQLENIGYCDTCFEQAHLRGDRHKHKPNPLSVPSEIKCLDLNDRIPRLYMELFAVVCIETSHYVAFVKTASGQDAPWVFFDSMADRKGEQNGYNIPEMIPVPDLPLWLSEEGARQMNEEATNDKMLPEHAKRLLCDAYMCMYQSTDVMMYR